MIDSIEHELAILQEQLNTCGGIAESAAFIREHATTAGFQIDVVAIKRLERAALRDVEEMTDKMAGLEERRRAYWESERKEVHRSYERSV